MSQTSLESQTTSAGTIQIADIPVLEFDESKLVYHQLSQTDTFEEGKGKPFHVDGIHLAVFRYGNKYYAVDNRCPHMGYPMSEGSVRDGVLICHWHHWEFDLKTGGCFLTFGDDLKAFPVEIRDDGYLYVGIDRGEREAAKQRVIDRGKRALIQGLKDSSSFLIAKAIAALIDAEADPKEIIQQGLYYGTNKTGDGWSSGVAILTIAANMWDDVDPKDHNLFLVHALTQICRRTSGSSGRQRFTLPRS